MQPATGQMRAVTEQTTAPYPRRWAALAVLMLPVLLVSVDNTVLAFALPEISAQLSPSGTQLLWINDVYPLILSGLLIPAGSLGDRYGRRTMLLLGGLGFTVISAAAAFAPTAAWLIVARAGMGIFGAMLMPATLSIIRNMFADATERRTAIAIWASGFSAGAALGPILGGFLLEHFYWGSVFLMAVPVLLPLLVLGPWLIPNSKDPAPGAIDPLSILLIMATMTPFVYAIKHFAHEGFDLLTVLLLVIAASAGFIFTRRQLARANPMLDVRLFTNKQFTGAVLTNLMAIFSLVGFLYFASQHLQLVSGHSPFSAALLLLPGLVLTVIAGLVVVYIVKAVKPWIVISGALLMNAAAFALVFFTADSGSDTGVLVAFALLGVGIGFAETLTNDIILAAVPPHKAGAASAISETAYETGSVMGTAVLGSILNAAYVAHLVIPAGISGQDAAAAAETLGAATEVAARTGGEEGAALLESAQHAFDSGVVYTSTIGIALMLVSAVMVARTLRGVKM
ncbi:MFS transporter [Rothia nasisuis]|uniref:MFS transporter n=1 Tax=Rothia nasisuis TaxID=2109647 RepID=UPI001F0090E7|nr:MFS transporter [Rothia nasisuis]